MSGKPSDKRVAVVQLAKAVLEDNPGSTLRRLHYLLCSNADAVAVGYQNTKSDYDSLGRWCTDARRSGELEYDLFSDPTRSSHSINKWLNPADFSESVRDWYTRDRWIGQKFRAELWVEKDGLIGVLRDVARRWQITLRSLHGQASLTACWEIANAFYFYDDVPIHIFHYGDFDPSGEKIPEACLTEVQRILKSKLQCERDIRYELLGFKSTDFDECNIESIDPKPGDSLLKAFYEKYGEDVRFAEVDALSKDILIGRVDDRLQQLVDDNRWKFFGDLETTEKVQIASVLNSLSGGEGTDIRA